MKHATHALLHLACGTARERWQQDAVRIRAGLHQAGDPAGQRLGLARASTGNDRQRAPAAGFEAMLDGLTLLLFRSANGSLARWREGLEAGGVTGSSIDTAQARGKANSVPSIWETTRDDYALVRMHGRNAAAWNDRSGHSGGRFNYDYDDAELEGLGHQLQAIDRKPLKVHVVLNNNAEDQAQRNGATLTRTLDQLGADVVAPRGEDFELR
jgi:hypothetical protein